MSAEEARAEVLILMEQKDRLEAEIQDLTSVLQKVISLADFVEEISNNFSSMVWE